MITVSCPDCGKSYKLKPTLIGKKGRCKVCDSSFTIEDPAAGATDDNEYAMPSPRQALPATPEKVKPSQSTFDDDELSGLNSVVSDGDASKNYESCLRGASVKSALGTSIANPHVRSRNRFPLHPGVDSFLVDLFQQCSQRALEEGLGRSSGGRLRTMPMRKSAMWLGVSAD